MFRAFLSTLFMFCISNINCQATSDEVINDTQIWMDFNGKYNFDERTSLSGFGGYRTTSPHLYDKIMFVPTYNMIHTKSPEFLNLKKPLIHSFHLGTGLFYTINSDAADNFEFRLMQGLAFFLPSTKIIPLKHYIRLEERFQKTFNGSNWNSAIRIRYRLSTVIEWKKHLFSFNQGMYIPLSLEVFFNLTQADQFNDVIRISPGLGYKFNDQWKAEFFISYHYTLKTTSEENPSNDFVFRLRIYRANIKKAAEMETKEEEIKELIE